VQRLLAVAALAVGMIVALTTGWWVTLLVLPAAVLGLPAVLMVSDDGRAIARVDAISEWARGLAGVLTAGQALEGALEASLRSTPEPIRAEVSRLVTRLRSRMSTEQALRAFADDLDDATGDLVVGSLILASARRGDGVAKVLTGLAESVAEDVRVRREIVRKQAEPRGTARTVTLISMVALAVFALTGTFLAPYGTPGGQLLLTFFLAAYAAALYALQRMSRPPRSPRFLVETRERGMVG
jgi:Flp pilus assembly protein TadB